MTYFITGKKVNLRRITRQDMPIITKWMNNTSITKYLKTYCPVSLEEEEKWYESLTEDKSNFVFALLTKEDTFFGIMGVHAINHRLQLATTGALIGDSKYHGKGYGTDAKMHLLHWVFTELNLRKVTSSVLSTNPRSQKYLEKTGYKKIGVRKENALFKGKFVDEILMEVFREDFMTLWEKYS